MRPWFALIFLFWIFLTLPSNAADVCVLPLENGRPLLNIEKEQPYRMARSPTVIPGWKNLVVKALNRGELYEISGQQYRKITAEFPHLWGFAFDNGIHQLADGDTVGIGWKPRKIYHLKAGDNEFQEVPSSEKYYSAFFDKNSKTLFIRKKITDQVFSTLMGGRLEPSMIPTIDLKWSKPLSVNPIFIPKLDGYMASTGAELWFWKAGYSVWRLVQGSGERRFGPGQYGNYQLKNAKIYVDIYSQTMKIVEPSDRGVSYFEIRDGLPVYIGIGSPGNWEFQPPSEALLGWVGKETQSLKWSILGLLDLPREPVVPKLFVLDKGSIVPRHLPGIEPQSSIVGDSLWYWTQFYSVPEFNVTLLRLKTGLGAFDGTIVKLLPQLSYDIIGKVVSFTYGKGLTFIKTEKAIFQLLPDLSVRRVEDLPSSPPWNYNFSMNYVEKMGFFLLVHRQSGQIFSSTDMLSFAKVNSKVKISSFVAELPDRPAALLVGEDGLYTVEQKCH